MVFFFRRYIFVYREISTQTICIYVCNPFSSSYSSSERITWNSVTLYRTWWPLFQA